MTLDYQIPYKDDELTVTFEAFPRVENDGIGSYEFWGMKGYDAGQNYISLEHYGSPIWNPENYTCEENKAIAAFINDEIQLEKLEDLFCKEYANQLNDFEP